jgi:HEAT repeat protein
MGKQRDRFEAWFARWRGVRTPDEEAAVLAFADAYDAAVQSGKLSPDQLATVVDAASSPRALLWMNATELLADLAIRWEIAAQVVAKMFASRQSHIRFAALCCLRADTPMKISNGLLRNGLIDKSSRVRWKAAQKIGDLERNELLPELEAAFSSEKNAKARREIELHLRLLRDGHIVKPSTPSGFDVTVRIKGGILSGHVTREAMQEKGIDAIAAELRSR